MANIARFLRQNKGQRNQTSLSCLFARFFDKVSEYLLYNIDTSGLSMTTKFEVFPSIIQIQGKHNSSFFYYVSFYL
jgi:hypothetical protein